jgi:hypothetical protein
MLKRSLTGTELDGRLAILASVMLFVALLYAMNAFGTLRLNTDAVTLLSSAISQVEGGGRVFQGRPTVFPPGYAFLVELQLRAGIASSFTLILLNWLLLLIGVGSFVLLLRTSFGFSWTASLLFAVIVMLNWVFIKHTPLPTTDIPYFGLAILSLLVIERARNTSDDKAALSMFLLAFLLVAVSISIRRVGISLLPVWIAGVASRPGWFHRLIAAPRSLQAIITVVVLIGIAVLLAWFFGNVTLRDYPDSSKTALLGRAIMSVEQRSLEVGEVMLNLPWRRIPTRAGGIFMIVGGFVAALVFIGLLRRRTLGVVEIYCLTYVTIIMAWWSPVGEPRLLIPVIPFVFVYAFIAMEGISIGRWTNRLLVAWALVYALGGGAALFYSARLTLAGMEFPYLYGRGYYRATYCHFLKTCPVEDARAIDLDAVKVLETFHAKAPSSS